jgi:tRNA(fMet)-specific endonuclease VapC
VIDAAVGDDADVAIAAISAAELLVGVALSDSRHAITRASFVEWVIATIPIEPYDLRVARIHAELLAHARTTGRARGAHDLIIAATARASSRTVVTTDATGFSDLPGVLLRRLPGDAA